MEMTRLETISDAAFAFATTLLVVSLGSIPSSYAELAAALKGIPAFAASFASITYFWLAHHRRSRRYGLEDGKSIFLSLCLIFIMLVYVYPLKIIFSALFSWLSGGWLPASFSIETLHEFLHLFVIYGLGYTALSAMITLLFAHALNLRASLRLNELEIMQTKKDIVSFAIFALTGLLSAAIAIFMPPVIAVYAGFAYSTLAISMPIVAVFYARKIARMSFS